MAQQPAARPVRTSAYFRRLALRPDLFTVPGADALSQPSIELMRAVITTHLDAAELGKDPLKATLPLRILEYARASAPPASGRGPSRRRASHFRASPLQHSRRQRNHPGRLDPKTAPRTLPQRHRRVGLSRHPDRIHRTRMGIHRPLKLYPHVQKRLRHVATAVAPPSQHWAIRAHRRVHQSVSAHRLHNTVQGPHGRLIRAPGTVARRSVKYDTTTSSAECSDGHHPGLRVHSAYVPRERCRREHLHQR
jgi:hypothetical protein